MCFDDDSHPPIPILANSGAQGEDLTLTSADGTRFSAYCATPGGTPEAQVVILPDVRGLHNFYRELAMRFADVGIRALVFDYFGRTAGQGNRDNSFEYMPHVQQMTQATLGADLRAAIEYLRSGDGANLTSFTVGFCMGGNLSFWAGTQDYPIAGVIGFYASLTRTMGAVTPAVDWAPQMKVPVLGLFGGADEGIPAEARDQFERGLEQSGVPHEIIVYPGAPHSFFDRKAEEFAEASADSWNRIQGFIAGHLAVRV